MTLNVLFFATLRDRIGTRQQSLPLPHPATVHTLRQQLIAHHPDAEANLRVALCAVNEEFAFDHTPLKDGDEVAFFPPVSGGESTHPEVYLLPTTPIDHDALIHAVTTPEAGAVVLFSGLVRGVTHKDGHLPQTTRLTYEAYETMALAKMRQVAQEIRARYPQVIGIALVQRLGTLNVGDTTVLIACSSAHRDSGCFEGAQYGINRLKEIVPVWKQEIGTDGAVWIEGDYVPSPADQQGTTS